jgi:hypothetical protein
VLNNSIVAYVFVAAVTFLPSRCLGNAHRDTETDGRFKKYPAEIGSGAMIYIPGFIKTGSSIQK